jgi:preprotein translocase YajC subunit
MNLLAFAGTTDFSSFIIPGILIVCIIVALIVRIMQEGKRQQEVKNMLDEIKVGDKVKTYAGIYGTVIKIVETEYGKNVILKTGDDENFSFMEIDVSAIYGIDPDSLSSHNKEDAKLGEVKNDETKIDSNENTTNTNVETESVKNVDNDNNVEATVPQENTDVLPPDDSKLNDNENVVEVNENNSYSAEEELGSLPIKNETDSSDKSTDKKVSSKPKHKKKTAKKSSKK